TDWERAPSEADDRVRFVSGRDLGALRIVQGEVDRCDRIGQVLRLGDPDNRCGDAGVAHQPGECDLRRRYAAPTGDGVHRVDDRLVAFHVQPPAELIGAATRRLRT